LASLYTAIVLIAPTTMINSYRVYVSYLELLQ